MAAKTKENAIFENCALENSNFSNQTTFGNFVNVYGSSGWHLVTIEQIKKFKMAFMMAARICQK